MKTYSIQYIKKVVGFLWWKREEWVWALFEEGSKEVTSSDPYEVIPREVKYSTKVAESSNLGELQLLRDKLVNGEYYTGRISYEDSE